MRSEDSVDSKATMLCLAIFMITGMGLVQMQPVLGGALVDKWGLSLQQMGVLFGVELVSMAVACAVAAFRAHAYDRRRVLQIALVVTLLANVGSILADGFVMLCIARLAVGVSGGVIQAIVYATTTLRANKDRTFALLNIAILLWGAVSLGGLPPLLAALGTSAVFAGFVALSIASLAMAGRMPRRPSVSASQTERARAQPIGRHGALLLTLFVLLFAGHGVLWVYQERIGKAIGISPEHIGLILGLSVLSGAVGAGLAGVMGARLSHRSAQVISFVGAIAATLIMVYGHDVVAYTSTACILMLVWFFGLTYMMAMAAEGDASGRLPGLANAAIFVGQGLGPAIGALAVGQGNFRNVGWAAAAIYAVGLVIAYVVTSRGQRVEADPLAPPTDEAHPADPALCH